MVVLDGYGRECPRGQAAPVEHIKGRFSAIIMMVNNRILLIVRRQEGGCVLLFGLMSKIIMTPYQRVEKGHR